MAKRMTIMIIAVTILFGGLFGYKAVQAKMMRKYAAFAIPFQAVTATKAELQAWQPRVQAVSTLRAYRGVEVASEISGLVREVAFRSGDRAVEGQVLVRLNADADLAQLRALEAAADLARSVLERDKKQLAIQAVSQATIEAEEADLRTRTAQVAGQQALVDKKTIRAPFSGRLGITTVNLGQYLNPGDRIVTLQQLDPLYADFTVPQQELSRIVRGQQVLLESDSFPGKTFPGRITVVSPRVDPDTRNFQVEAVIANQRNELLPGMYATVRISAGKAEQHLTLPQTAITYNPYGDTVYIIEEKKTEDGKTGFVVRQSFVTLGPSRGDQVAVLSGVKEGDLVVTSGQLKLRNGSAVVVNNAIQPPNEAAPKPEEQ